MKKQIFSMLLVICMLFSNMPITAMAVGSDTSPGDNKEASGNTEAVCVHTEHNADDALCTSAPALPKTMEASATEEIWDGSSAEFFEGGTGTAEDPYLIATAEQLALLSGVINQYTYNKDTDTVYGPGTRKVVEGQDAQPYATLQTAHYKLTANIVLNDTTNWENWTTDTTGLKNWKPMGVFDENDTKAFSGTFDGDGKTIGGMYYSDQQVIFWNGSYGVGGISLFGYSTGRIENVSVAKSHVSGWEFIGGLVGGVDTDSTVTNCTSPKGLTKDATGDIGESDKPSDT